MLKDGVRLTQLKVGGNAEGEERNPERAVREVGVMRPQRCNNGATRPERPWVIHDREDEAPGRQELWEVGGGGPCFRPLRVSVSMRSGSWALEHSRRKDLLMEKTSYVPVMSRPVLPGEEPLAKRMAVHEHLSRQLVLCIRGQRVVWDTMNSSGKGWLSVSH